MLKTILRKLKQPFKHDNGWAERTKRDADCIQALLPTLLKADSNCVDVGAHTGEWLDDFLKFAPQGKHFGFEGLPELAEGLKKRYPSVRIEGCAVSDTNGKATFHRAVSQLAWSGLRKQDYGSNTPVEQIEVPMRTLDSLIGDTPVTFMKLDIEGAEHAALLGARETIRKSRPSMIFEYAFVHVEEYKISPEMIWDLLVEDYKMGLFSLDRTPIASRQAWTRKCQYAAKSEYGRDAETNFLTQPV